MPFSWKKKTRCNRFSQLVADHLQSPKHGGSLVVETGFPTSLIDLYVRNRGRFRKSSEKKQKRNDSLTPLSSSSSSSSSSDSLVNSGNLSSGVSDCRENDEIISDCREIDEIIEEDVVVIDGSNIEIDDSSVIEVERSVEMAKLNPVVAAALKVLFVVVLILGTKRFKFGITVSAFVLFFLELVGKPLLERLSLMRLRSCVDSKTLFESSSHGRTKNIKDSKENTTLFVCSQVVENEIEEQIDSQKEVRSEKELDQVKSEVLVEIKCKSSRKSLMKSRMKKLVPKKLRKSSIGSIEKEEETAKCGQDFKPLILSSESSESKVEILCVSKKEQNKIVEIEAPPSSPLTLLTEINCSNKKLRKESQQNYGCLILCLIVLIGLIGGRVLALVLALSWCLIQKKSPWRNVKFPIS